MNTCGLAMLAVNGDQGGQLRSLEQTAAGFAVGTVQVAVSLQRRQLATGPSRPAAGPGGGRPTSLTRDTLLATGALPRRPTLPVRLLHVEVDIPPSPADSLAQPQYLRAVAKHVSSFPSGRDTTERQWNSEGAWRGTVRVRLSDPATVAKDRPHRGPAGNQVDCGDALSCGTAPRPAGVRPVGGVSIFVGATVSPAR